jgi:glycosyltransferase involved in cell wall biosynthesis
MGGAEHLLVDLLPQLMKSGHQVDLLLLDGTKTPFYQQLEEARIPIYTLGEGINHLYQPIYYFRLRHFLRQHSYDVIHTHNTPAQWWMAWMRKRFYLVTTEHSTTNRRREKGLFHLIDRWMYHRYDRIVCVSEVVRKNLLTSLNQGSVEDRVTVIPNGVSLARFSTVASNNTGMQCSFPIIHQIVMVASMSTPKDQPTLIRAFKLLPEDYHLILVGDGPCRKACETLAQSLHIAHRVTFTGVRTDVPELLAKAEVVVLSSHYEGMPLACIEAMAAGKPVIASAVDGLQEVVEGAGLLFPHQDAQRLATLIERICTDDALRAEVVRKCLARASQYDLTRMVEAYLKIYEAQTLRL